MPLARNPLAFPPTSLPRHALGEPSGKPWQRARLCAETGRELPRPRGEASHATGGRFLRRGEARERAKEPGFRPRGLPDGPHEGPDQVGSKAAASDTPDFGGASMANDEHVAILICAKHLFIADMS